MREILFRGKRMDNDEWCFGTYHYSQKGNHHYIIAKECFLDRGEEVSLFRKEVWEVFPETVGQFVCVANDIKLFEGDILKVVQRTIGKGKNTKYKDFNIPIKWCHYHNGFVLPFNNYGEYRFRNGHSFDSPLIGNIHDNPELLKN